MSSAMASRSPVVATGFVVSAVAVATLSFWPTYRSGAFLLMVAVTIAVGGCIAVLGARFRASSAVVAAATVLAFIGFGVPLAVPSESIGGILPTGKGILDLVTGAALGWKQLVTIQPPVGSYQALLVPPYLLVLLASVVGISLATRAPRGEWALIPPLVLFVAGIVFGPQGVPNASFNAVLLLCVLLAALAWFTRARRVTALQAALRAVGKPRGRAAERGENARRIPVAAALAAALVVVIAAAAGTAGSVLAAPTASRAVLRAVIEKPFDPNRYPSPLTAFRSYLEPASASAALFSVSGLNGERRIRIATLDSYDGVVYAVGGVAGGEASATFSRVPARLEQPSGSGRQLSLSVSIQGYRGVWLPSVGSLESLRFAGPDASALDDRAYHSEATGASAILGGLHAGDSYHLESTAGRNASIAELADAAPGRAKQPRIGLYPDGLEQAVERASDSNTSAGAKLSSALSWLASHGYISHGIDAGEPPSRSGHGADRIDALLSEEPMIGDQEQYAVTAALMARRLGFPARVVVGFVVPKGTSASGNVTVTGADISAWIQVQTARDGWLNVDPNPSVRPIPPTQEQKPKEISRPQTAVEPPRDLGQHDTSTPPDSRVTPDRTPHPNALLAALAVIAEIAGFVLLVVAVVCAPFLTILAAKLRRRRLRRRAASATTRITGGWQEFADTATDHGFDSAPGTTRSELASSVGGDVPAALAIVADRVVFSPVDPSQAEADAFWRQVDRMRRSFSVGRTRRERLRAALSLRSLNRYRGVDEGELR